MIITIKKGLNFLFDNIWQVYGDNNQSFIKIGR